MGREVAARIRPRYGRGHGETAGGEPGWQDYGQNAMHGPSLPDPPIGRAQVQAQALRQSEQAPLECLDVL